MPERPLWQEVTIAFASALRATLYFLLRAIPLLLLFFIPVVNIAAPFIWAAFGAWMLALQYLDYPLGNHGIDFSEQRRAPCRPRPHLRLRLRGAAADAGAGAELRRDAGSGDQGDGAGGRAPAHGRRRRASLKLRPLARSTRG